MTYLADFCSWFQNQPAAHRVELLVTLLQMLHPLELRFINACMEEMIRRDSCYFRECEIRSNTVEYVSQLTNLNDPICRSQLVVALSLLYSGNYSTGSLLFKTLLKFNSIFYQLPKTKQVIDEVMLILVMAKHHPSFVFDQRANITEILEGITNNVYQEVECGKLVTPAESSQVETTEMVESNSPESTVDPATRNDQHIECCSKINVSSDSAIVNSADSPPFIAEISMQRICKIGGENVYDFEIIWSNKEMSEISKTLPEIYRFHKQLVELYPMEAESCGSFRNIPYFPGHCDGNLDKPPVLDNIRRDICEYIKGLVKLPAEIVRSDFVQNFFKDHTPASSPVNEIGGEQVQPHSPGSNVSIDKTSLVCVGAQQDEPVPSVQLVQIVGKTDDTCKVAWDSSSPSSASHNSIDLLHQNVVSAYSACSSATTNCMQPAIAARAPSTFSQSHWQYFIRSPLYSVLQQSGLVEEYKRYLYPRSLEELCLLSEHDLMKAGLPLEPCYRIIMAAKNYMSVMNKHMTMNGNMIPKFSAAELVAGQVIFIRPSHYRPGPTYENG